LDVLRQDEGFWHGWFVLTRDRTAPESYFSCS